MGNKALKEARKAYYKNQQTKGGKKKAQQNKSKVRKPKEKAVSEHWESVREKTQTAGRQGEENRKNANVKKIAKDNAAQAKKQTKSGAVKPVKSNWGEVSKKSQTVGIKGKSTKVGKIATGVIDAPVTSYAQHTAKNASDLAGWASKQAYRAKENQGRERTHTTTRNDRQNVSQKTLAQKQLNEQKAIREKVNSKEFKASQKEYVKPFKEASKKMEKAQEKTLERGAKALGLSDEKKYNVPFAGKMSAEDIYKSGNKVADELVDYLIPYGGTTKGALKAAEGIVKAGKAAKAGKVLTETAETGAKVLSKDGKKLVREYAETIVKGGDKKKALDDLVAKVGKSDLKQNIKKELIANAMQDATIGTTIDYAKAKQQGLEGKELAKYMGENALLNAAVGVPVSALAGRTGKAGKAALKNEINTATEQSVRGITEENRLARRLGAKGLSPQEVQNALSKQSVKDYINLTAQKGKKTLTVEQQKHLDRLTAQVEAQKVAYDNAINESVKATRESIGKASAIDVSRLRRAVNHYETTGNKAAAKEARQLLKQAEKNFDNTLDTVTKAAANVSDTLKREYKIESVDEILESFANTGGRISDPSQFHGFAEFDKDGNIVGYHVNKDSEQALEFTFGHEFTHGFESLGKDYDDFVNDLKTFVGDEWDEALERASMDYANVENADFEKEAVANLVAKHFFSEDGAYLKKLAGENPSMFSKIYNMIKKLLNGVSEHDAQFEALSKRMDEMFDSLSVQNKSIIKGSPDTTEMLFGSLNSAGRDSRLMGGYYKAIQRLEEAEKKYADDYLKLAEERRKIFKDTSWFQGVDGKWRYEISDAAMRWTGKMNFATSTLGSKNRTNIVFRDANTGEITVDENMAISYLKEKAEIDNKLNTEKLNKKQKEALERRRKTLESNLKRYELFSKKGLPISEVLSHSSFYKMFPEAKDLTSGIYIRFGKLAKNNPSELSARTVNGKKIDDRMLTLNRDYFNPDSDFYIKRIAQGEDPETEMLQSIVHELQHYVQGADELSKGTGVERFAEDASDNIYPKVYDRDVDRLNEIKSKKEEYLDKLYDIDGDTTDKFLNYIKEIKGQKMLGEDDTGLMMFDKYKPDKKIESLYNSGDKNAYANYVFTQLIKKYKLDIPDASYKKYLANYLYRDFEAAQLAERDVKKIYDTTLGEMEARQVEERLFEHGQAYSPESHRLTKEERGELFPMDDFEGKNVRYNEYQQGRTRTAKTKQGTFETRNIEEELPDRFTSETGLVKDSGGTPQEDVAELPVTRTERSQTSAESEADYYDSLAANIKSAEKELEQAKQTTQPKPKKSKETVEPKAEKHKEKKGMIERERRDDTKKRDNETAKKAFDTLKKEYGKDQGWVDAVTGKREDGAFGKLKVKGASEAAKTVDKEFDELGYDKLLKQYFKAEVADDPYIAMARANKLLGEIDRRLKSGDYEPSALYDEATDIIEKYSGITSLGSNILSSAKKFLTSTPQGRKRVVLKEIERLEKRYKDRIKGGKIVIDDAKIDELMHATGAKADDLLDELNKEIWEQIPASIMERLNEYRHCFMLFNAKTHGRNVIGNGVFRMARALSDDMEQRILNSNAARSRIGKMQGGKDPSEVIINRQKVTHKELKDNYMYLFNEFHAIYDKSGSRNKFIETGRPDGVPTVKFKPMQKLIDLNYAALEKEDLKGALIPAFNKSYLSYCKARCPEGKDLRKFMEEMTSAQKEKARKYALAQGEYATFRDSCAFSDWLTAKKTTFAGQKGKTKWGTFGYRALDTVLEGAIPFVKTPVNIFRRSVDYSPASLIMSLGKLAKADSPEMFQLGVHQLCTGLTGTGMAGLGVLLASQGLITVKAGEESGDAYMDRDMGFQDYSLKITLGDKQYSWTLDWMSPMNMSLFAGAAFEKMFEQKGFDNQTTLNAFFAITSPMTDMSFMSSPKDTVERFMENAARQTEDGEPDFAGALAQLIVGDVPKNYVSGFFPQLMSQFAGVTDDYRRDTKSTRENVYLKGWESSYRQLLNKVPWARKLLNKKLDRRGEDVKNDENIATRIINSFFNPATVKEITMDEQDRELIDIRNHMDKTSNQYRYFYYNFTGNPPYDLANGKRMTYKESYDYAKASRVEQNINIKNMLDADSYKDMSWDMKAEEVDGSYWIGKAVADKDVYGFKYAMNVLKNGKKKDQKDYNTWVTYKENAGGEANKDTYWNYYIEKERMYNRSHATGEYTYRVKGLPAIQSGDQALIDAVDLKGNKETELKHYWEIAKQEFGKKAKEKANREISDFACSTTTNLDKAGVESENLGMLSASAGVSANNGKKAPERVYRGMGQFWNSAQAGGGLMLKYNTDGRYDLKNLEKLDKKLNDKLDKRPDKQTAKDCVCEFIEKDLGVTNADEAACLWQVLYGQGNANPNNKTTWKNPYKDTINDWLEWGENRDDEWGDGSKKSGGGGGYGRRRRGRHGGGGSGGKGKMPSTSSGAIKGSVSNPFSTSNGSSASNLNDAYRSKVRKLRGQINKM